MDRVPEKLSGRFYFPDSSAVAEAELRYQNNGFRVTVLETGEMHFPELRELGDRIGNVPRKIYFTDGSVFECADNDAVDLAFGKSGHFASRLTKAEGSWRFVIVATVVTFACLFGIYRYGIPAAATFAANNTPSAIISAIDSGAQDTVDRVLLDESNLPQARKDELTVLFNEVAEASGHKDPPLQLVFRDGGRIGANALALPGGTIILTDQLEALAKHEDELAGVFAHEIGHVNERHSLRQIYRVLGLTFMISLIGGDSGQIVEDVAGQFVLLETFSYTREFETSADTYAVKVMSELDRNPMAFVDLLDRLLDKYGIDKDRETSWLDTHPVNKDRRENVRKQIERFSR
ncbi:MAG: M48 family metallopeptidase [Pseudomonadota bacterium]